MKCELQRGENAALLLEYCEHRLAPEMAAVVEQHLAVCPECAQVVDAQHAVWAALEEWRPAEISADFEERLLLKLERERHTSWWRRALEPSGLLGWKPAMPLAAACLALVAILLFQTPPTPTVPAGAETIDVDQVDNTLRELETLQQLGVGISAEKPAPNAL